MIVRRIFFGLTFFALAAIAHADQPWTEVRSQHFRVLTNGQASDAKHVAHEFEQMRYVFATQFPKFRLDSGAPLTIFAARDEQTAKMLVPSLRKNRANIVGLFQHGWEKQFVMLRLDVTGLNPRVEVYHEYTHSILSLNTHWLPVWLNEGMAEFYSYTRFEQHKIYIGAPTLRLTKLQGTPIPIEELINARNVSSFYSDADKADKFYAESWALVHYMIFGPNMNRGAKLNQFLGLIQQGVPQATAFQQLFGSFAEMDKQFDIYMRSMSFHAAVLQDPPQIDEKSFTVRKLTQAQTDAELAGFHLWNHDLADARPLVEKALQLDPKLGLAHEEKGFLLFADGEEQAAREEFSQAYSLDGTLYLSLFAKTMLSPMATSSAPADEAALDSALSKVTELNPQFAPAYVQLARLAVRQGNLAEAFGLARRAEELEPSRAGYHLLTGQILLRMGKGAQAAQFAEYVAKHWIATDHDEAVELWNSVPAAERPAGVTLVDQTPKDTQTVAGVVKSSTCGGRGQKWTLVLDHDGKDETFAAPKPFAFGFSDTLWWGEDHFSTCSHLAGRRAIVAYRPSADASYAGNVVEVDIRNDLTDPATGSGGKQGAVKP